MNREALITALLDNMYSGKHRGGKHKNIRGGLWLVLHYLYQRRDTDVFPGDLCEELDVTTPRVTTILNQLEDSGLIQRIVLESDRRKVRLKLTQAGLQHIEDHNAERREEIERLIDRVGEEKAQIYLEVCSVIREERDQKPKPHPFP